MLPGKRATERIFDHLLEKKSHYIRMFNLGRKYTFYGATESWSHCSIPYYLEEVVFFLYKSVQFIRTIVYNHTTWALV